MVRRLLPAVGAAVCLLLSGCGLLGNGPDPSPLPSAAPVQTAAPTPAPTPEAVPEPSPEAAPEPVTVLIGKDTGSPVEVVLPVRGQKAEGLPLSGTLICLDPGHCVTPLTGKGYTEPVSPLSTEEKGLYSTGTQGKYATEEQVDLAVGLSLRDRLEELGATVVMTRTESRMTISGLERCEIANAAGADVAIRIHCDGSTDPSVHGVSVLVPDGDLLGTPSIQTESLRLGQLMVEAVAAQTGAEDLGTIGRRDLTGFNFSQVPSVLIEMGFMTNADEGAKLASGEYQAKIVEGMVQSVLEWYGADASGA